jgi:hypothetical protein
MDTFINLFIFFLTIYAIFKFIINPFFRWLFLPFFDPIAAAERKQKREARFKKLKDELALIEEKKLIEDNERIYNHKLCAYCHSYSLTKLEEKVGEAFWRYANLNGSQDMRRKNINYQLAGLLADHRCRDCGAITLFSYYASDSPSTDGPIFSRLLLKDSPNENIKKIGYNWPSTEG